MSDGKAPHVAVIGAGPAGLMAAEVLSETGARVTVYERMPSAGRKFLLAGRGGLNLTHSESPGAFLSRYRDARARLLPAIEAFDANRLREWAVALGEDTFVGSSGRVFPKSFKASPLLRAWLRRLDAAGVAFRFRRHWLGWDSTGALSFAAPDGRETVTCDATVLALGGASWPRLGSDGSWVKLLADTGIKIAPLRATNCGFLVGWSERFREKFEGQPLKRIALSFVGETARGDAVITREGIEGGVVYALSAPIRETILRDGEAVVEAALRPDLAVDSLVKKLATPRGKQSFTNFLRKTAGLSPVAIGLLQESAVQSGTALSALPPDELASLINRIPLRLAGIAPVETAISTAGGVAFGELGLDYMLRRKPGVFAAGEMLDWEAPTGGYLLQACFATGAAAGRGAAQWLARGPQPSPPEA